MNTLRDAPGLYGPPDEEDSRQSRRDAAAEHAIDLAECPDHFHPESRRVFADFRRVDGKTVPDTVGRAVHGEDFIA